MPFSLRNGALVVASTFVLASSPSRAQNTSPTKPPLSTTESKAASDAAKNQAKLVADAASKRKKTEAAQEKATAAAKAAIQSKPDPDAKPQLTPNDAISATLETEQVK